MNENTAVPAYGGDESIYRHAGTRPSCSWLWNFMSSRNGAAITTRGDGRRMVKVKVKVKVRQQTWIHNCDWETKECRDEPASGRAGPPVTDLWLFADCAGMRFATSKNSDRSDSAIAVNNRKFFAFVICSKYCGSGRSYG